MTDTSAPLTEKGGQNRTCAQRPGIPLSLPLPYLSLTQQQTHVAIKHFVDCSVAAQCCLCNGAVVLQDVLTGFSASWLNKTRLRVYSHCGTTGEVIGSPKLLERILRGT